MKILCFFALLNSSSRGEQSIHRKKQEIFYVNEGTRQNYNTYDNDIERISFTSHESILCSFLLFHIFCSLLCFIVFLIFPKIDFLVPLYTVYTGIMILINMTLSFDFEWRFILFHSFCLLCSGLILLSYFFFNVSSAIFVLMTLSVNIIQIIDINQKVTKIRRKYMYLNNNTEEDYRSKNSKTHF